MRDDHSPELPRAQVVGRGGLPRAARTWTPAIALLIAVASAAAARWFVAAIVLALVGLVIGALRLVTWYVRRLEDTPALPPPIAVPEGRLSYRYGPRAPVFFALVVFAVPCFGLLFPSPVTIAIGVPCAAFWIYGFARAAAGLAYDHRITVTETELCVPRSVWTPDQRTVSLVDVDIHEDWIELVHEPGTDRRWIFIEENIGSRNFRELTAAIEQRAAPLRAHRIAERAKKREEEEHRVER